MTKSHSKPLNSQTLFYNIATLLLLLHLTTSCTAVRCDPRYLQQEERKSIITINSEISYNITIGKDSIHKISIKPGKYCSVGRDNNGTWYLGDNNSIEFTMITKGTINWTPPIEIGVPRTINGGIFVPHNSSRSAMLFTVQKQFKQQTNTNQTNSNNNVTELTINQTPQNASTLQAGIGAGIASAIINMAIESEKDHPGYYIIDPSNQPPENIKIRDLIRI